MLIEEMYVWYLFSLSVWCATFLHGCVLMMIWRNVCVVSI